MAPGIGVHLYHLRHAARDDLEGTLRRIADIGFVGIEVEGLFGMVPARFRELTEELGLTIVSMHMEEKDAAATAIEAAELGARAVIDGFWDVEPADLRRQLDSLNGAVAAGGPPGVQFGYHNQEREFTHFVDGRRAWDVIVEELHPRVFFEVDYAAAAMAHVDPLELVRSVADRARILHIRDVDGAGRDVPVGAGSWDTPAILAASTVAEWHIVEHEDRDDLFGSLEACYRYLVGSGLSRGAR